MPGAAKRKQKSGKAAEKIAQLSQVRDAGEMKAAAPKHGAVRWFERFARQTALLAGRPVTFFAAAAIVLIWLASGPIFNFSDTWQLVINTGTTIVTFLMVFLIQQSQNRDTMALQVKLAELIIAVKGAHNALAAAEELSEQELSALHADFCRRASEALKHLETRHGNKAVREAIKKASALGIDIRP